MIVPLKVEYVDRRVDRCDTSAAAVVAAERRFDVGWAELASLARIEALYWLAWESLRRSARPVAPFDDWLETVVVVDLGDTPPPPPPPPPG